MRNEAGVSEAGLLSDGLDGGGGWVGGGDRVFAGWRTEKKDDMDSSELVFLQKWRMKIKVKTSHLFGGECPWHAGCADRSKGGWETKMETHTPARRGVM